MKREHYGSDLHKLRFQWASAIVFVVVVGATIFISDAIWDWAKMPVSLAALHPIVPPCAATGLLIGIVGMFIQTRLVTPTRARFVRVRAASFLVFASIAAVGVVVAVKTDDTWIILPFCITPLTLLGASFPRTSQISWR